MSDGSAGHSPALKSVNRTLAGVGFLATGWAVFGTYSNIERFLRIVDGIGTKLPVPRLTLLAFEHQTAFVVILIAVAATCAYATFRKPERKSTSYLNISGIVVLLAWWVFQTTAFYFTLASTLRGMR